jgi:outer membrane biosynthesis protein TonB
MRKSLIVSFALHAMILGAALVVLPNPETFKVQMQDPIQVDISMIGDVSKRQAQSKAADKKVEKAAPKVVEQPKKADPKPKVAEVEKKAPAEPPPPAPKPPEPKKEEPRKEEPKPLDSDPLKKLIEKQEEPKPLDPDPLKDLLKKTEDEKKPEKKPEKKVADAKPVEKKKPEKKKPKLDVNDLSAFLNKEDTEQAAPQKQSDETGTPTQGEQDVQGTDDALAATIGEAVVSRLKECWSVPPGAREADITVRVLFRLNPDATVAGLPEVLNSSGDPVFPATAQSAVSAVTGCQFSDLLPPDKYELWKEITVNFNPNMMFGT